VVELEDKAQGVAAQAGQGLVVQLGHRLAVERVATARGRLQQAQDVEQGALA
jgi:hypothetical protein